MNVCFIRLVGLLQLPNIHIIFMNGLPQMAFSAMKFMEFKYLPYGIDEIKSVIKLLNNALHD